MLALAEERHGDRANRGRQRRCGGRAWPRRRISWLPASCAESFAFTQWGDSGQAETTIEPTDRTSTARNERDDAVLDSAFDDIELAETGSGPWHDPSLSIDERMAMAAGKPLAMRMMAAMAQQDCRQCGYDCAGYANALVLQEEERLTLCATGGKETARLLKQLVAEIGASAAAPTILAEPARAASAARKRRKSTSRATIRVRRSSCRAAASMGPIRRRRPGTSSSTSAPAGWIMSSATASASFPRTIPSWSIR